jgi:hypothetical protein
MKKCVWANLVVVVLAVTALGQEIERRWADQERGRGGRGRGPMIGRMIDRLAEELDFDDEQMAQIDEIVAAHEQRMQETHAQWQEVRAATEAGDEERAAELREQLRQRFGERGEAMRAVLDEIEPLLREDQLEQFQQWRERMSQRMGPGGRDNMRRIARELPDAVNMTEEQREEFEELLNEQRAMMQERMHERMQERRQRGEGGEGDRAERRGRRGRPGSPEMREDFFEQVAEILNEDQLELLADYRAQIEPERPDRDPRQSDDLRNVLSAAKRIQDLSGEQKEALWDLERDAMRSSRELGRRDREGQALLAAGVKKEIEKLLDEQQTEEFQQNLERQKPRGRRGDRGDRWDRGRRDRDRQRLHREPPDSPDAP